MIRDRRRHGLAARWTWFLGTPAAASAPAGWKIAQAAGRVVFDRRTVTYAASGTVEELDAPGPVRRTRRPRRGNLTATVPYRGASFEWLRDWA